MARIVGGLGTSHVPIIGRTMAAGRQADVPFAPFFHSFAPVHDWVARVRPDIAIVLYNDHGLNFFLDNMPTFAVGVGQSYRNEDEGWGQPAPRLFRGAPELSWHIVQSLIAEEFDISTCQDMAFDHAGITALDLVWPGEGTGHGDNPVAVIPIVVNAVQPPFPTPLRCYKLGQAIGRAIASFAGDAKVLVIGSGGLSHELGQSGKINREFDLLCLEKIVSDPSFLARYSNDEIVDLAGAQGLELMNWIVMRGAVSGDVAVVARHYELPISHTGGAMMLLDPNGKGS